MTTHHHHAALAPGEHLFTSESVTEGHPDKMADQISDAVLDAILTEDPNARVACETLLTTGMVVVSGEVSTSAYVDIAQLARQVVVDVGYDRAKYGFDGRTCGVMVALDEQSPDIAQGVDTAEEQRTEGSHDVLDTTGAGDQGMMFGYATTETDELLPLPIVLAHRLTERLAQVRKDGTLDYVRPDGKAQVTVRYRGDEPVAIDTVLISTQHAPDVEREQIERDLIEHVIRPSLGEWWTDEIRILVNPTGVFVLGGPHADTGLTGRKIIVDTYGGAARHGGGAFSGKDPTKVDRSAAYAARWVAKHVVAAGLARRCELQVAYAIGVAHPVSLSVETFGTATVDDHVIERALDEVFDLRPAAIIEQLDLRRPIYRQTAAYVHFGRPALDLPWERLVHVDALRTAAERLRDDAGDAAPAVLA